MNYYFGYKSPNIFTLIWPNGEFTKANERAAMVLGCYMLLARNYRSTVKKNLLEIVEHQREEHLYIIQERSSPNGTILIFKPHCAHIWIAFFCAVCDCSARNSFAKPLLNQLRLNLHKYKVPWGEALMHFLGTKCIEHRTATCFPYCSVVLAMLSPNKTFAPPPTDTFSL